MGDVKKEMVYKVERKREADCDVDDVADNLRACEKQCAR
jgi:hypothetical protein